MLVGRIDTFGLDQAGNVPVEFSAGDNVCSLLVIPIPPDVPADEKRAVGDAIAIELARLLLAGPVDQALIDEAAAAVMAKRQAAAVVEPVPA